MPSNYGGRPYGENVSAALEEALASFDEAIRIKPDYVEAWFGKGITLAELDRFAEALACFEEAIRIKPDYAEAWNGRAKILRRLKEPGGKTESGVETRAVLAPAKMDIVQGSLGTSPKKPLATSNEYWDNLANLERRESSETERPVKSFKSRDIWDSNPFKLLSEDESLVVDGSNLIRQRCEPHNGKPCNNPARLWILHLLLHDKEQWEKPANPGAICLIVIDASLRHHVADQGALDELSNKQAVIQMPPGHPSDSLILKEADEMDAVVLSNDAKMRDQYASQYPWLREPHRFINYVVVSDNPQKIEYVRNARFLPHEEWKHKRQVRAVPSDVSILRQPPVLEAETATQVHENKPQTSDWLTWLRSKTTGATHHRHASAVEQKDRPENKTTHCTNCGAPIDLSNTRIRFCYRCRAQIVRA